MLYNRDEIEQNNNNTVKFCVNIFRKVNCILFHVKTVMKAGIMFLLLTNKADSRLERNLSAV
jgi:hypothetical protein